MSDDQTDGVMYALYQPAMSGRTSEWWSGLVVMSDVGGWDLNESMHHYAAWKPPSEQAGLRYANGLRIPLLAMLVAYESFYFLSMCMT